jgi:hypothetical protein
LFDPRWPRRERSSGEPCLPGSRPGGRRPSSPLTVVAGPNHRYLLSHCRRRARLVDSAGFDPTPHSLDRQHARRRYGFRSAWSPALRGELYAALDHRARASAAPLESSSRRPRPPPRPRSEALLARRPSASVPGSARVPSQTNGNFRRASAVKSPMNRRRLLIVTLLLVLLAGGSLAALRALRVGDEERRQALLRAKRAARRPQPRRSPRTAPFQFASFSTTATRLGPDDALRDRVGRWLKRPDRPAGQVPDEGFRSGQESLRAG